VLHVPGLQCNLLSVLHLICHKSFVVCAENTTITFSLNGTLVLTACITDRCAAFLDGTTACNDSPLAATDQATIPLDLSLWHWRTMHHNLAELKHARQKNLVTGVGMGNPCGS